MGPYMDGFIDSVSRTGYTPGSFRSLVHGAIYFGRYLACTRLTDLRQLTDKHVQKFIASTPIRIAYGRYPMHVSRGARAAPHVLHYLQQIGVACPPTPLPTPLFAPLLEEWLSFLRQHRGLTEESIHLYRRHVARFLESLGRDATPTGLKRINAERIRSYIRKKAVAYGRSERKTLVSTLRLFLGFAWVRGYLRQDLRLAVERVPAFKHEALPRGPRWEDALRLLKTPNRSTTQGRRDYAILLILLTYGVRALQVAGLRMNDLDWRGMKIRFPVAKGGRSVDVPLTRPAGEAILEYLRKGRPSTESRNLFLSLLAPVRPLASGSVSTIVSRAFHIAGIPSPHRGSHALRHAWATRMLSAGRSLKIIADLMGHRQIETTRIYAKVDFTRLRTVALPWPKAGKR
ncbi:tyrosine-type recombinase/integrase [Candidatus Bathyarchaeota archaeon]|nr:tyrosine-type recombinase/integrase [Candidatus Bathyarchaeota archaeon]